MADSVQVVIKDKIDGPLLKETKDEKVRLFASGFTGQPNLSSCYILYSLFHKNKKIRWIDDLCGNISHLINSKLQFISSRRTKTAPFPGDSSSLPTSTPSKRVPT